MRRTLLGSLCIALLLVGFFLIYFAFSGFRGNGQSYASAVSDFGFMLNTIRQRALQQPPEYSTQSFNHVMQRFSRNTHWEVREAAHWTLQSWGEKAAPSLREVAQGTANPYQLIGAAQGLAQIHDPQAVPLISALLQRYAHERGRFRRDLIDAFAASADPAALPLLIDIYQQHGQDWGDVLSAIGRCGGVDFLLKALAQAKDAEAIRPLMWPLAESRAPEAAGALTRLLWHPNGDVRVRAYSALGQEMRKEAVAPVVAALRDVRNEYVLRSAINQILGSWHNRGAPDLVPFLSQFLRHPTLARDAQYALARIGGDEAVAALETLLIPDPDPALLNHLDELGTAALPLLKHYFAAENPALRKQAIGVAVDLRQPAVRPLLESALDDTSQSNRRAAREALFALDRLDLLYSFSEVLPTGMGRSMWHGFRSDMRWGFRRGYREVLQVFAVVHMAGLVISGLIGLLLALRRIRIFDTYRFTLFVAFLLSLGQVGNFFLLGGGNERSFMLSTGVHLLLLCGFLFQERERVPGELRGRFETLGGASLWLILPPLLYFGTPLVAEGLRLVLHDFWLLFPSIGLTGVCVLLVLEQWALPWRLVPRGPILRHCLAISLMFSLLLLVVRPLWLLLQQRLAAGDMDGVVIIGLLIAPLVWMGLYYLLCTGSFGGTQRHPIAAAPAASKLHAINDGDRITVASKRQRSWRRTLGQSAVIFATGAVAAALAGAHSGAAPGMVLAMLAGLLGAALAGLIFDALLAQARIQVRAGHIRGSMTHFGAALGGAHWFREPSRLHLLAPLLDPRLNIKNQEQRWLAELMDSSRNRVR